MNRHALPSHWSPEQALAVYELLQQLSEQLWAQYQGQFIDRFAEAAVTILPPSASHAAADHDPPASPGDELDPWHAGDDLPF